MMTVKEMTTRMMTMTREDAQHIRNLSPSVTQSPLSRPNALAAGFGGGKSHNGSCNISIKLEPAGPGSGSPNTTTVVHMLSHSRESHREP